MKVAVTVDLPNMMKGTPVEVPPVGLVDNGSTVVVELNDDQAKYVSSIKGVKVDKAPNNVKDEDVRQASSSAALSPVGVDPAIIEKQAIDESARSVPPDDQKLPITSHAAQPVEKEKAPPAKVETSEKGGED